jgi:DNA-binding GntR family transcriptional regulator
MNLDGVTEDTNRRKERRDERSRGLKKKPPLDRPVLRDQIREYLVEAILQGEFEAGERVIETRVAQELGVSQGAVREALRELEWMGFLETKPFSGSFVRALSVNDLQEIYPVRAVLEALAAKLAVPNLTDADLDELEQLVDEMVRVSEQGDERGMVERNYSFHRKILHATHNSMLIRAWSMFQFSYWTSVSTTELHDDLVLLAKRHYQLVEGFRSRDPERAAERAHEHITWLLDRLANRRPQDEDTQGRSGEEQ